MSKLILAVCIYMHTYILYTQIHQYINTCTLVVGEQTGFRIVPFRVSGARTSKFAGHCNHEHAQLSKTTGLSSVCSLHKSTCFGFVSWFFFNVQFFAFTFMFYQLKWEVKFVPSRQFGSSRQVWRRRKRPTWSGKTQRVFHSIRRSKLLIFTTRKWVICVILQNAIVCCMHVYVWCRVFGFFRSGFLTLKIVAVALGVRNRTSTTNSLDLLLGIKRMGEQTVGWGRR